MRRINPIHHATSFCRFVREMQFQVAPACIQDALGQMAVVRHIHNQQIFQRNFVVHRDQLMRVLTDGVETATLTLAVLT